MKRLLVICALALSLGGCASVPSGSVTLPNITGASITAPGGVADAIKQVQTTAQQICSFVPTVETVSGLLNAFGVPYVGIASDIAAQVCAAVTTKSARRGGAKLRGVAIRGKFVR